MKGRAHRPRQHKRFALRMRGEVTQIPTSSGLQIHLERHTKNSLCDFFAKPPLRVYRNEHVVEDKNIRSFLVYHVSTCFSELGRF